ncbi:hypothetical protein ACH5RR_020711 [Cinchona calisaya]|uniref:Uncharacterized protein n=1 Tax=Cinchona calisaya TaxID=153742 RepID=A0ABD2ZI77_9GENT
MEHHLELERNLIDQEVSQVIYIEPSHQACQSTKLGDRFKLGRNETSSADFHPKIVRNLDSVPQKPQVFHRRQRTRSKADELGRYMSSLPSYLERAENIEEKAFNVGFVEWRRLEKWQYIQRQVPQRSCKSSPSNSNASSFSSTEGSSSNSDRGRSCSPANQRMHHPGLVPNPNASPSRVPSLGIKSFGKNGRKFQDLRASSSNYLKVSQSILSTHQSFNKYRENRGKECKNTDPDPLNISEKEPQEPENHSTVSNSRGVMKFHFNEPLKEKENLQVPSGSDDIYMPSSDTPHSCPLPCEANNFRSSQIEQPRSTAEQGVKFPFDLSPYSGNVSASPSRGRNLEGKKLSKTLDSLAEAPNLKLETEEDRKVRNPSPIRRLMGRIVRSSSSRDTACSPQRNPETDRFCSRGAETSVSLVDSSCDKSYVTGKGRSSPLRRLIDPLLKPRASNFDHSIGSLQRDSSPIDKGCKLSEGRGESARHSMKVRLDLGSCKTNDIDLPKDIVKCGSSTVQALLQVAVKNGLPLFTFALDNSSHILAATMRKLSPGKRGGNSWLYTFFTVQEMKKRNGRWLNQGNKDRTHGYVPNVVAQMKVSDVPSTDLIRQSSVEKCTIREFVLLGTNKGQGDGCVSDVQANDELAAIVLNLPKMAIRNLNEGDQKTCEVERLSMVDLEEPSYAVEESWCSAGSMDLPGLAVILPGGDHGIPIKGEPSPLIDRWRSGGSCDCGGWDLGCGTRVLSSQFRRTSGSTKSESSTGKFQLYSQEQRLDKKPIFSLSPFKDGIYSVEFNSSLKLLQAFSVCIAFLNGLQPAMFYEYGYFSGNKSSEESAISESDGPN